MQSQGPVCKEFSQEEHLQMMMLTSSQKQYQIFHASSFLVITQELGVSVFHEENKISFTLSSVNLKGLAKVTGLKSNNTPDACVQDTGMHQASDNLCNSTCSLTLSSHFESTLGWRQKRPLSSPALSNTTVLLCLYYR